MSKYVLMTSEEQHEYFFGIFYFVFLNQAKLSYFYYDFWNMFL